MHNAALLSELACETIEANDMPEPYRGLLAHDRDMTSTLEAHFGQRLRLEVLAKDLDEAGGRLSRRVVLVGEDDSRAAEFGAIRIMLDALPAEARADVIACERPLGSILHHHGVAFTSSPTAFFRIAAGDSIPDMIRSEGISHYFGRQNTLRNGAGGVIAEIVEVLPNIP